MTLSELDQSKHQAQQRDNSPLDSVSELFGPLQLLGLVWVDTPQPIQKKRHPGGGREL